MCLALNIDHANSLMPLSIAEITLLVSSEEIAHNNVFRSSDSRKGTTTYHVPKEVDWIYVLAAGY